MTKKLLVLFLISFAFFSCKLGKNNLSVFQKKDEQEALIKADAVFFEAIKEKNKDNQDKALSLFEKTLTLPGEKDAVHFEISKIYDVNGNYEKALHHIEKALSIRDDNKWYWRHFIEINTSVKQWNKVEQGYLALMKIFPDQADYPIALSDVYLSQGEYDKTLKLYNEIESKIGVTKRVNQNKYLIYKSKNENEKALIELEKLSEKFPEEPEVYLDLANFHFETNNPKQAKKSILKGLDIIPKHPELYMGLGDFFFNAKQYDSAFIYYDKAISDYSFSVNSKIEIIEGYFRYRNQDEYVKNDLLNLLESLTKSNPLGFKVNSYLAEIYQRLGDNINAKKHIVKSLEDNKNSYDLWEVLISIDFLLGEYNDMEAHSEEAKEYFPLQPKLYYFNGLAKEKLEKIEAALGTYKNGLSMTVGDIELKIRFMNALADLYNELEDFQNSDAYFEQILTLDANNAYALNNYAYYLSLRKENLDKAEIHSKKSLDIEPQNPSFLDTYGWILFQKNQFQKALKYLIKAHEMSKNPEPTIIKHIIETYDKLEDKEGQLKFEEILKQIESKNTIN